MGNTCKSIGHLAITVVRLLQGYNAMIHLQMVTNTYRVQILFYVSSFENEHKSVLDPSRDESLSRVQTQNRPRARSKHTANTVEI